MERINNDETNHYQEMNQMKANIESYLAKINEMIMDNAKMMKELNYIYTNIQNNSEVLLESSTLVSGAIIEISEKAVDLKN
jgi:uncharacterized membrane-anchored protein YhcB (DUF1043 family)